MQREAVAPKPSVHSVSLFLDIANHWLKYLEKMFSMSIYIWFPPSNISYEFFTQQLHSITDRLHLKDEEEYV